MLSSKLSKLLITFSPCRCFSLSLFHHMQIICYIYIMMNIIELTQCLYIALVKFTILTTCLNSVYCSRDSRVAQTLQCNTHNNGNYSRNTIPLILPLDPTYVLQLYNISLMRKHCYHNTSLYLLCTNLPKSVTTTSMLKSQKFSINPSQLVCRQIQRLRTTEWGKTSGRHFTT